MKVPGVVTSFSVNILSALPILEPESLFLGGIGLYVRGEGVLLGVILSFIPLSAFPIDIDTGERSFVRSRSRGNCTNRALESLERCRFLSVWNCLYLYRKANKDFCTDGKSKQLDLDLLPLTFSQDFPDISLQNS